MKIHLRTFYLSFFMLAAVISVLSMDAFAQDKAEAKSEKKSRNREFCSNNNWSDENRSQFRDVREMTLPATGSLNVDGGQNGGVRIIGEDRGDVQLRACIQTWADSDDAAKALATDIRIETGGTIKAVSSAGDKNWSVSYEILAPRNTSLSLKAHNGGISISGVEGRLEFETMNGGVVLRDVAGDVKGRTTNGGVVVSLAGSSWKGSGLDVQTTNGGVVLSMAENYAAHVETGTVNGGFKSDFPALTVDRTEKWKPARISADINGGGPTIRVITTNGGIKIGSAERGDRE
jgi:putative adhesin